MAYDGTTVAAVVSELNEKLSDGSIVKIAQPERDELLLTCKNAREQYRVTISANPSAPLVYLRDDSVQSPLTAPNFCMCLRKHIGGGRIRRIYQPAEDLAHEGLERIIVFEIEHRDEMGEPGTRYLVAELMGKYSNIILLNEEMVIMDSIRHISHMMSSVREVLPGRNYFIPNSTPKANPREVCRDRDVFCALFPPGDDGTPIYRKIYQSLTGLSPTISYELLARAGIEPERPSGSLTPSELEKLCSEFSAFIMEILEARFVPNIVYDGARPLELAAVKLKSLEGGNMVRRDFPTISEAIRVFYSEKEKANRIKSRAEDLRVQLRTLTERAVKKLDLLERQYKDTDNRDRFRVYGELINAFGYSLEGGEDFLECENYYDGGKKVRIPLDPKLSASENAVRYFNRYQKLKRTREAAAVQIKECRDTLYHLESITNSLSLCVSDADFAEIRREMYECGYIRSGAGSGGGHGGANGVGRGGRGSGAGNGSGGGKGRGGAGSGRNISVKRLRPEQQRSKPMHFVSSDGIDIYVGRNNYQNEELSFRIAGPNDWWFHAKNIPGSHVIARTGNIELPDRTCLEAAALAAYYSSACAGPGGRRGGNIADGIAGTRDGAGAAGGGKSSGRRRPGENGAAAAGSRNNAEGGRAGGAMPGADASGGGIKVEVDYVKRRELKKVPGAAPGFVIYHTNYSIMIEPKGGI